jgi:hypothetical protein
LVLHVISTACQGAFRLLREALCGGYGNAFTSALLNPMDVMKTRMQAERLGTAGVGGAAAVPKHSAGMFSSGRMLYSEGGIVGMWRPGITATVIREMFNCSARTGLYVPVRDAIYLHTSGIEGIEGPHHALCLAHDFIIANLLPTFQPQFLSCPNHLQREGGVKMRDCSEKH